MIFVVLVFYDSLNIIRIHIFTLVVTLGGGALSTGLGGGFGFMFGWVDGETWVLGWSFAGWTVDRALAGDFIDFVERPILACGV